MPEPQKTVREVDLVLERLRQMTGETISLSQQEAEWLLAEIDGGREAFGVLAQKNQELQQDKTQMRRTIDDLLAARIN